MHPAEAYLEFFIISMLNGISFGLLLFMLSSGLTLIFGMMGVLNFAHASFYMLGAYFAYSLGKVTGFWGALLLAPIALGAIGALVERYGLRAVHKFGHVAELLFTFGLAYLIDEAVHLVWGRSALEYRVPPELDTTLFTLFSTNYPTYRGFMMLVAVVMLVSIFLILTRTRIGLIIQAALTHPEMVQSLGHDVPRLFMLVFAGGAALAGLAGVIGGNAFVTDPGMASSVGSIVFVVVVIGGLGSLMGAFIASLALGLMQTFSVALDYSMLSLLEHFGVAISSASPLFAVAKLTIAQMAPSLPFVLLILMLVIRPKGLMGTREN